MALVCLLLAHCTVGNDFESSNLGRKKSSRNHVGVATLSLVGDVCRLSRYYDCYIKLTTKNGQGYQDRTGDLTSPRRTRYHCAKP